MTHDRENYSLGKIFLFFTCFLFAITVRACLLTVNLWSNDNHIDVAKFIIDNKFPVQEDCWQCYHSHLYHWIIALIFKIFHIVDLIPQVHISQSLNSIFGLATIFLILKYVFKSSLPRRLYFPLGMLVSVFPAMVSSDIQGTNDSLAILLATLFLWLFLGWIRKGSLIKCVMLVVLLALAPIAKGTNLAFVFAILFDV